MPLSVPPEPPIGGPPNHPAQRWPWWPLLPLYPYGRRRTLVRELLPGTIWSFEQLHGVWYVAVPIRMTVLKVGNGLLLYSPIAPTPELLTHLRQLELEQGPVHTIVLATASGLEHKIPVPALARAFPGATLWVTDQQWSFPLQLPPAWLGFPNDRTKVIGRDGLPHGDQLAWIPLGPLDLGLGPFLELACLDRATGSLLVTDALVSIRDQPPALFGGDPTPLLFHARETGSEPLTDTPSQRRKGWKRIVLFANYFRPACVQVPGLATLLSDLGAEGCRDARSHFGFYPFRWADDWEREADRFLGHGGQGTPCRVAPVLERLVFPRAKARMVAWLEQLARQGEIRHLISAHYDAPQPLTGEDLMGYADLLGQRDWAPSEGSWHTLAAIDRTLLRLGVVGRS
ncbi:MAG: DUF4336 domain-containing protein [Cyanobacteriota bacterium]|nr:DUF4336 domain-containing protein [Cyanobacteriota bacterium]